MTKATPQQQHETAQETRLRERLAAVQTAWRYLDAWIEDRLDDAEWDAPGSERNLTRHRERMASAIDLLEREWVLR